MARDPSSWGCRRSCRESPAENTPQVRSGLWNQKLPLAPVQYGVRSLGEMLFSPWPLCQKRWLWQMHLNALFPFLVDLRLIREKRFFFFFYYFWHLASAVLGQPSNTSESPSVQNKEAN